MSDKRFTSPEELDAILAGYARSKHDKLWKDAEGRTFRPTDIVAVVVATLMFLNGMFGSFEEPVNGTMQIAFALFMIGFILLMRLQAQMKALGLLVRQLEQKRQTGE